MGGGGGPFGGEAGPLRLLNEALGGQAGWLLGFALVAGVALVVSTRLRRSDPVTGWLIAVGGSALTAAVAFSFAQGIFHPYYVSELAPFVAALVGAGVARFTRGDRLARIFGPLAVAGGVITSLVILGDNPDSLPWLTPVLIVAGAATAAVLAFGVPARIRNATLATAVAFLLIAPATWSVQTLDHATSGTFPAGGPTTASAGFGGPGGRGGGPGGGGGFGGPPAGANGTTPGRAARPPGGGRDAGRRHGPGHERRHRWRRLRPRAAVAGRAAAARSAATLPR